MDRLGELMEMIRTEYGIETPEQLYKAIKELEAIDITPICVESRKILKFTN